MESTNIDLIFASLLAVQDSWKENQVRFACFAHENIQTTKYKPIQHGWQYQ